MHGLEDDKARAIRKFLQRNLDSKHRLIAELGVLKRARSRVAHQVGVHSVTEVQPDPVQTVFDSMIEDEGVYDRVASALDDWRQQSAQSVDIVVIRECIAMFNDDIQRSILLPCKKGDEFSVPSRFSYLDNAAVSFVSPKTNLEFRLVCQFEEKCSEDIDTAKSYVDKETKQYLFGMFRLSLIKLSSYSDFSIESGFQGRPWRTQYQINLQWTDSVNLRDPMLCQQAAETILSNLRMLTSIARQPAQ